MATFIRFDHVRGTPGPPPASDLPAPMSGIEPIPSGVPSGPDVADSPGHRGKMIQLGHSGLGLPSTLAFTSVSRQEFAEMKRLSELQDTRSWTRSLCAG